MSGYPVPQRQGEKDCECGEWQGSWVLFTELKANPPLFRPQNGSIILYNRKKVKYRKDGYLWKKRKDGKTTREDHMKLKVQGMECLYGCYVHSSIVPTFHRRCYWLLQVRMEELREPHSSWLFEGDGV